VAAHAKQLYRIGRVAVDVGCGDGRLCAELKAAGWPTVLGLDASRTRIESARRSYPGVQFQAQLIAEAGLVPDSVDLMILDNVLEHLPNPKAALLRLSGFLHPNGTAVIITPNMRSGHFRLLGRRWTPELAPHVHVFLFTPASLARLVSDVGLELTASGTFHLPLYSRRYWLEPLLLGELKEVAWRAAQEAGGLYGRLLGAGPMQYVVVRRSGVSS
jgi:2-polyprenyl-3-methyl-5-hydroxy-6-metoxy-1,4-benzoquinol methylase